MAHRGPVEASDVPGEKTAKTQPMLSACVRRAGRDAGGSDRVHARVARGSDQSRRESAAQQKPATVTQAPTARGMPMLPGARRRELKAARSIRRPACSSRRGRTRRSRCRRAAIGRLSAAEAACRVRGPADQAAQAGSPRSIEHGDHARMVASGDTPAAIEQPSAGGLNIPPTGARHDQSSSRQRRRSSPRKDPRRLAASTSARAKV